MFVDRILDLANLIEAQSIRGLGFNMATFGSRAADEEGDEIFIDHGPNQCGTVACIAGTCAISRGATTLRQMMKRDFGMDWDNEADYLGLEHPVGQELFFAGQYRERKMHAGERLALRDVPLAQAVRVLRNLAITGKVDWAAAEAENDPVLPLVPVKSAKETT